MAKTPLVMVPGVAAEEGANAVEETDADHHRPA